MTLLIKKYRNRCKILTMKRNKLKTLQPTISRTTNASYIVLPTRGLTTRDPKKGDVFLKTSKKETQGWFRALY